MARKKHTCAEALVHEEFDEVEVRLKARELGVVKRSRKVDAYALLLTVLLAVTTRGKCSLSALRRAFRLHGGVKMARSAFFDRFSPEFETLVKWGLDAMIERSVSAPQKLPGKLARFSDIMVLDASVMKVDDSLEGVWRGTRKNSAKAALKVHTLVRALSSELLRYRITADAFSDAKAIGAGPWMKNVLLLFDRGYPSPSFWWRIHRQGGFFLTRLPTSYDPVIVEDKRRHRGRARRVRGSRLRAAIHGMKRRYIDVVADFRVHVRPYRKPKGRNFEQPFRVVGVRHPKTRKYHLYVTNASVDALPAEMVWDMYRLRWEVELFYKAAKSGSGMNELPSTQPHVVRTLVYAALMRATLAMKARTKAMLAAKKNLWINPIQWMTVWNQLLVDCLERLLLPPAERSSWTWTDLAWIARDPNRKRKPTRERLVDPDLLTFQYVFSA